MNRKACLFVLGISLVVSLFSSCEKPPGEGGTSSIIGRVYTQDYNQELTFLIEEYYLPNEDVYIVYGNDSIPDDDVETNWDGYFRFDYLRPGKYTVYAYSKDIITRSRREIPIKKEVEITAENQLIDVGDIVIIK